MLDNDVNNIFNTEDMIEISDFSKNRDIRKYWGTGGAKISLKYFIILQLWNQN